MKQAIILIISVLFCSYSTAQIKLEGRFKIKDNHSFYTPELDDFIFRNDGKIVLIRDTDLGTCFGFGVYSIINNKMEIKFDLIPVSIKDSLKSFYTISNEIQSKDTLKYELSVMNNELKPLENPVVKLIK